MVFSQHSLVRVWNEQTLKAIRNDLARPPIHARNLFHVNAAMYDAWAAYDTQAQPWLLGRTNGNYTCAFPALPAPADVEAARKEAMSFAVYRILRHRFLNSPGYLVTYGRLNHLMDSLGYDRNFTGIEPSTGGAAALGNYIAQEYIAFGRQDGSNENGNYANQYYAPVNASLQMIQGGNLIMNDPNRWQPITLPTSIDQAGNPVSSTPGFVGAEWGNVVPFSLTPAQRTDHERDGHQWPVYLDPGPPGMLDVTSPDGLESFFKWNHLLVSVWQSHLDPAQDVMWNISPGARGNNNTYPQTPAEYATFYDLVNGGDHTTGHVLNPVTGQSYPPNFVDRGNYARVLAEFWADGVDSETPPGHWFEILHNVMDMPDFHRRWMGQGPELDALEYDVKSHFALGSAMHDAAIVAWGIKGYYDTVRPVSAIRYMGDRGQCSDPELPRYHVSGLPLIPGFIELVLPGDPIALANPEDLYKMKLYTYKGPGYVSNPATDVAGVGWILSEDWWPYQRPTFVTPPFAGYVSGHSTYSRTAAEVLTSFTGSEFFPGGMIEYVIPQNEFLVFEDGPDEEVRLQWATYRDASDACSLSRIWGGIHPPMDDIPGRVIGMQLGPQVVDVANQLFTGGPPRVVQASVSDNVLGPVDIGAPFTLTLQFDRAMDPSSTVVLTYPSDDPTAAPSIAANTFEWTAADQLEVSSALLTGDHDLADIDILITGAMDTQGKAMAPFAMNDAYMIDTHTPGILSITAERDVYSSADIGPGAVRLHVLYDEAVDPSTQPALTCTGAPNPSTALTLDADASGWASSSEYVAVFDLLSGAIEVLSIQVTATGVSDPAGNTQAPHAAPAVFAVDTRAPQNISITPEVAMLSSADVGSIGQTILLSFDEPMDQSFDPTISFVGADPLAGPLARLGALCVWNDDHSCQVVFSLALSAEEYFGLDVLVDGFRDVAGNTMEPIINDDLFSIDMLRPTIVSSNTSTPLLADADVGDDGLVVQVEFSEPMDTDAIPHLQTTQDNELDGSIVYHAAGSSWSSANVFEAAFHVVDRGVEVADIDVELSVAKDASGNSIAPGTLVGTSIRVDTRNPVLESITADPSTVTDAQLGAGGLILSAVFDEPMDPGTAPTIVIGDGGLGGTLLFNEAGSQWASATDYSAVYDVQASIVDETDLGILVATARDEAGNAMVGTTTPGVLAIQLSGVGIAENGRTPAPSFGPNPLAQQERLFIHTKVPLGLCDVRMIDAQGRSVHTSTINLSSVGPSVLDLPAMASGAYEILLDTPKNRFTARIVVMAP